MRRERERWGSITENANLLSNMGARKARQPTSNWRGWYCMKLTYEACGPRWRTFIKWYLSHAYCSNSPSNMPMLAAQNCLLNLCLFGLVISQIARLLVFKASNKSAKERKPIHSGCFKESYSEVRKANPINAMFYSSLDSWLKKKVTDTVSPYSVQIHSVWPK